MVKKMFKTKQKNVKVKQYVSPITKNYINTKTSIKTLFGIFYDRNHKNYYDS